MHETGREELWKSLPGVFDLPEWVELHKDWDELF